jgi:cation transport ATPase
VIEYRDEKGSWIQVAAPAWITEQKIRIPKALANAVRKSQSAWENAAKQIPHAEPQLRPLWILRDGLLLGLVTFHRAGELEVSEVVGTLRARNPNARFLLISKSPQAEANALAAEIGIATALGGLSPKDKARTVRELGNRTMWIGNGADPDAADSIQASTVSISVAGAGTVTSDKADIVLLQPTMRGLVTVRHLGRRHRAILKRSYRAVFAANLLCLGGAFFAEFTTLIVALVSNTGTGGVFAAQRRQLHSLAARMEKKMGTRLSAEHEDQEEAEEGARHHLESFEEYGGHSHDSEPDREIPV